MCAFEGRVRFCRIYNSLMRTLMLIIFGMANINNGLTPYTTNKDSISLKDDMIRNINQNLIKSPTSVASSSSFSLIHGYSSQPPSSSSASSSLSSGSSSASLYTSSLSSSQFHRTSGSSISSFDSANILMPANSRQLTREQQQQQLANFGHDSGSGRLNENLIIDGNTEDPVNREQLFGEGSEIMYMAPMYFGTQNSTIVTTQIGAIAHIPCTVHHIGDGVVSWIRKKDYHLLTVGLTTYSSDERFSATHLKNSEDWTLQIKFVQLRDAGVYECQVSTHPPTSIFLHLNVVVCECVDRSRQDPVQTFTLNDKWKVCTLIIPTISEVADFSTCTEARAEISGPPIRYLTPGSTLRLQCRVVQNTEASEFIFWYHDNRMINYDIDRGINVSTEADFQSSELTILKTRREHSGNFTCVASNTQPASVLVHIFKGDNPAAMYHGHVGSSTKSYQTHLHSIMLIISIGYRIFISYVHIKIV